MANEPESVSLESAAAPSASHSVNIAKLGIVVIAVALGTAVATGLAWQLAYDSIPVPSPELGQGEVLSPQQKQMIFIAKAQKASVSYGVSAGLLGLALGLAGGWVSQALKRGAIAGAIGLVLGVTIAAGASFAAILFHDTYGLPDENGAIPLHFTLIAHAIVWGLVGAVAGLALGGGAAGFKPPRAAIRAAAGGAAGGLCAAIIITVVGALLFPADRIDDSIVAATPLARWFQVAIGSILIPVVAWAALRESPRATTSKAALT